MVAKSIAKMYTNIHKPTDYGKKAALVCIFVLGKPSINLKVTPRTVAYPGGVSGCPETPPAMICFNQGGGTLTGTDLHICEFWKPP